MQAPQVKTAENGKLIALSGDLNRFVFTGEETSGRCAQWEAILPPGGGPPVHLHRREDETVRVLAGEVTARIGDQTVILQQGSSAYLPIGVPHGFTNHSQHETRVLFIAVPAGIENFFFETGVEVAPGEAPPEAFSDEEKQRIKKRAAVYGIEFLGGKI